MPNQSDRFFVLTGGPGSGKTTLIEALRARGFATSTEAGRAVIREEAHGGGRALPWLDPERFAERMFEWELGSYRQAQRETGHVFFDRGLPDTLGYLRLERLDVPVRMEEQAWRLRYNRRVFVAPPWKEIFGPDEERRQSWQLAVQTCETMVHTYRGLGYDLVSVPLASVQDRLDFVIGRIGNHSG